MKLQSPAAFLAPPLGFLPQASNRMCTLASFDMNENGEEPYIMHDE